MNDLREERERAISNGEKDLIGWRVRRSRDPTSDTVCVAEKKDILDQHGRFYLLDNRDESMHAPPDLHRMKAALPIYR